MTDEHAALLQANEEFYRAFTAGDFAAMDRCWAEEADVACIHPGWSALRGREQVMASWELILGQGARTVITCRNPVAHGAAGMAFVICEEVIGAGILLATNVFVREGGRWRMVHHHASPSSQATVAASPPRQH